MMPATNRFYVAGGTLPLGSASYLERDADVALYETLRCGELCYLLNARQMGKSSLINRVAQRLRTDGVAVVLLDLTAIGQNLTASQWYYGLLNLIAVQLGIEDAADDFWDDNENMGVLRRFFAALKQTVLPALGDKPLVIAVDEIDAVRSITTFATDEFFAGIRAFYLDQQMTGQGVPRVTFCLLGTATPTDLIKDPRVTPFNIGKRIELGDFTPAEAMPLAAHLPGGAKSLEGILFWTGGHPYLTQSLCQALTAAPQTPVDTLVADRFLSASARDTDDNLKLASNRLLLADCDKFALLSLYRRIWQNKRVPDDDTNPLCDVLKLSGAVKSQNGFLTVRNNIYRKVFDAVWAEAHLPDAELRRQRGAFRRGLVLASTVAAVVLTAMSSLYLLAERNALVARRNASRAEQSRNKARTQTNVAERASYTANINLIGREWDTGNINHVLQLLEETKNYRGRGFEWDYWNRQCHREVEALAGSGGPFVYSPDGRYLFTNDVRSTEASGILWNARTLKRERLLQGVGIVIYGAAFSPDSRSVVTCGGNKGGVFVWDAATGKLLRTLAEKKPIYVVNFSPDGKHIALTDGDGGVKIAAFPSGKTEKVLPLHSRALAKAPFAPNGKYIATISAYGEVQLRDSRSGKVLWGQERQMAGLDMTFSPDGKFLVAPLASHDMFENPVATHRQAHTAVWDTETGTISRKIIGSDTVFSVAYSPDGKYIATGAQSGLITIYDANTGSISDVLRGHDSVVTGLAFSMDGRQIASAGHGKVNVWSLGKKEDIVFPGLKNNSSTATALMRDGNTALFANKRSVGLQDLSSGKRKEIFRQESQIRSLSLSSDEKQIVVGGFDGIARILDADGAQTRQIVPKNILPLSGAALSPN
ncbi:MAG: AAA-like domain-containing protein [Armatimonadetes bacterium]|nr:AAA-like domain-containing protein [Armatimonadota bacterium]